MINISLINVCQRLDEQSSKKQIAKFNPLSYRLALHHCLAVAVPLEITKQKRIDYLGNRCYVHYTARWFFFIALLSVQQALLKWGWFSSKVIFINRNSVNSLSFSQARVIMMTTWNISSMVGYSASVKRFFIIVILLIALSTLLLVTANVTSIL